MTHLQHRERENMSAFQPRVEPSVLNWARDSAMLSMSEAARLIGVPDSTVEEWEAGKTGPTINQLRHLATVYGQPMAVFLLHVPPADDPAPVVRRALSELGPGSPSRSLVIGLRRAVNQQVIARYLSSLLDEQPDPIAIHLKASMDPERAGVMVREWLGISMARQRSWRSIDEAFQQWVAAIEAKRILVIQVRRVSLGEMRTFAERSRPIPVIGLNEQEATAARIFSLIRTLVQVLLNAGSASSLHVWRPRAETSGADNTTSQFCNRAAAAVLIPLEDFMRQGDVAFASFSSVWSDERIRHLSAHYQISAETLSLRLVSLGKANAAESNGANQPADAENQERATRTNGTSEIGDDSQALVRDLGRLFVSMVLTAYDEERISSRDVTRYLGVGSDQLPEIARIVGRAG